MFEKRELSPEPNIAESKKDPDLSFLKNRWYGDQNCELQKYLEKGMRKRFSIISAETLACSETFANP